MAETILEALYSVSLFITGSEPQLPITKDNTAQFTKTLLFNLS